MFDPLVIVRTVHFAACTVATGTIAFAILAASAAGRAGLADDWRIERRFRGPALAALVVAAVSGAIWLILIARNILDVPLVGVLDDGGLALVALETRFGRVACMRLALTAMTIVLLLWRRPGWPVLAATTAIMATIALTGHAGAGTGTTGLIHAISDVVHLVAAGFWLGALPAFAWLLLWSRGRPERGALAAAVTRRFSRLALIAVVALAASGMVNTAILVGWPADPFADPLATTYARALALKVVLFGAMLALAAVNRFRLTPALPRPGALGALAGTVCIETLLGLGVLLLAGVLGTHPPASHMHSSSAAINRDAAFVHIHTSQVMADLVISPGRAGDTKATIQLWHEDYRPFAADGVRLTLEPKRPGPATLVRDATLNADGTWIVDPLRIQAGGEWIVQLTIKHRGMAFNVEGTILLAQCSNEC